ncbi:hypothetical protein [Marinicellulosiphila megalodicopiae]|uniref:hypothetical protein n=1 Tax=Marinicellulosiphila megalodicopiae TaxID=2724896 RepID=UPI003BAE9C9C
MKLLFIFGLALLSQFAHAKISVAVDEGYINNSLAMDDDLIEAYRRVGVEAEVFVLPPERAIERTISGAFQALDARLLNPQSLPGLIAIPEPIYKSLHFHIYSLNNLPPINNFKDLEQYTVGYARNQKIFEQILIDQPNLNTYEATDYAKLYRGLEYGRADVVFVSEEAMNGIWTDAQIQTVFQISPEPILTANLYHHIHPDIAYLLEPLTKVIRQMKLEGYFGG